MSLISGPSGKSSQISYRRPDPCPIQTSTLWLQKLLIRPGPITYSGKKNSIIFPSGGHLSHLQTDV